MKPWAIVVAIAAGLGIVALLIFDSDERGFSDRANAESSTRPGVQLAAVAGIANPEDAIVVIVDSELLADEIEAQLEEVREQLATAREQAGEQAQEQTRERLEQANNTLDDALERVEDEAEDTDNLARQSRLEQVHAALTSIQDQIEVWLEQL